MPIDLTIAHDQEVTFKRTKTKTPVKNERYTVKCSCGKYHDLTLSGGSRTLKLCKGKNAKLYIRFDGNSKSEVKFEITTPCESKEVKAAITIDNKIANTYRFFDVCGG